MTPTEFAPLFHDAAQRVRVASCFDHALAVHARRFGLSPLAARLLIVSADHGAITARAAADELCAHPVHLRRVAGPAAALVARGYVTVTPRLHGVPNTIRTLAEGLKAAAVIAAEANSAWESRS